MRHRCILAAGALLGGLALLLTGCGSNGQPPVAVNVANHQTITTPGARPLSSLTWYGDYRPVYSLDPIKTADYPEETILPNVCTSLLQLDSAYRLQPSIASAWKQTSPTSVVFTIRSGVRFSDGSPLTAQDVVYSLNRNLDPANASAYFAAYATVKAITSTGPSQVTVTFKQPNTIFPLGMATLGGAVVSERYAKAKGKAFGTPQGGVMCAGPYRVSSYDGTHDLTLSANRYYWDAAHRAKTATVHFVFPSDATALTNAIGGGAIDGAFDIPPSDIGSVEKTKGGKLWVGGASSTPQNVDIITTNVNQGSLDDKRVRQALSLAIDRPGLASKLWGGAAQPLYAVAGPGLFGPNAAAYQPTYDALAQPTNLARAKQLISQAGAKGSTIRLAYPSDVDYVSTLAIYLQQVGRQLGLHIKLIGQPSAQFGNLFIDPGARAKVDAFITINYLEFPSPAAMIQDYATPDGFQNYGHYANPTVTSLIEQAYATSDPARQAALVNQAQRILAEDLPWIPLVSPSMTLYQASGVTGAPLTLSYMSSPWLAQVGGA